ncbi:MAG TPA: hypothetical protein VGL71_08790, partial [Urbifossiella sp.]
MRRRAAILSFTFAGWSAIAAGQENRWQPVQPPTPSPVAYTPGSPSVTLGPPSVSLGPPVAAKSGPVVRGQSADDGVHYSQWVAATLEPNGDGVPAIAPLPVPSNTIAVSATSPYTPPLAPPPPAADPPGAGFYPDPTAPAAKAAADRPANHERKSYFGELFNGLGAGGPEGKCLESDHCFDNFASPVSNPFYFEDPRSLTEV